MMTLILKVLVHNPHVKALVATKNEGVIKVMLIVHLVQVHLLAFGHDLKLLGDENQHEKIDHQAEECTAARGKLTPLSLVQLHLKGVLKLVK